MTEQDSTTPAVWDPTARGGAGGWVRRKPAPEAEAQPPAAGAVGDQGPPLLARPYLPPTPSSSIAPSPAQAPTPGPGPAPGPYGGFPPAAHPAAPAAAPAAAQLPFPPQPGFPQQAYTQPANTPPAYAPAASTPPPYAPPGYPPSAYPAAYPPAYPPAPGGYEEVAPFEEASPRRRTPMFIALGVLLTVVLGVGVVWAVENTGSSKDQAQPAPGNSAPQPAPTPAGTGATTPDTGATGAPGTPGGTAGPGPNAAAEAKSLDDLLARDESTKSPIGNAVAKVNSCPAKAEVDSAAQVFDAGATQRDQLIASLAKLNLADVPGGAEAATSLHAAWQASGDIDRAYAAWARTVGSQGCSGGAAPNTADLKRANDLNPQATQAKKDFVAKWNSLAGTFGLTPRTWDRI